MRLLNVRTLKLEEFVGSVIPEYAILSHTWGEDEASFSEFAELGISRFVRGKSGYTKIKGFCKKAYDDGFQHVWIDTCCIDKRSSAELSEAINSMFKWYQRAKVCYVYLEDVSRKSFDVTFSKCRWFQRGWTLQELLAPRTVRFFDNTWNYLNDKTSLAEKIAMMTGISTRALLEPASIHEYSAALRMSWASKRETTRIEDSAYCLFGIFAVNMPLLYGEGEKAFLRLQEEILRNSSDCSILAWDISLQNTRDASYYLRDPSRNSALALHPRYFNNVRNIVSFPRPGIRIPHQISSDGLYINMPLLQLYWNSFDEYTNTKCIYQSSICSPSGRLS
ncbi:heterokaryon incompatibility protein-domain-containing protein [Bisporella sp. PMI_857]|nr:heterokaryon incompatibility protein-domain-containing protein [Bisporella sp. PMI_857]